MLNNAETNHQDDEIKSLMNCLSEYGLSPSDWQIIREKGRTYKIENRYEPGFHFRGTATFKKDRLEWRSISLSGI